MHTHFGIHLFDGFTLNIHTKKKEEKVSGRLNQYNHKKNHRLASTDIKTSHSLNRRSFV